MKPSQVSALLGPPPLPSGVIWYLVFGSEKHTLPAVVVPVVSSRLPRGRPSLVLFDNQLLILGIILVARRKSKRP